MTKTTYTSYSTNSLSQLCKKMCHDLMTHEVGNSQEMHHFN